MLIIKKYLLLTCTIIALQARAQQTKINILDSGRKTSIRGLSVVNDNIVWASGSNGTVARSVDGGKTFEWLTVSGYEKRDFRDIEAFDANTAIIMGVAEPAIILKTKDAGQHWYKVFEDSTKGMFLDAMDFVDNSFGNVLGDPIENRVFNATTMDSGEHWIIIKEAMSDTLINGEAFFAASGTNIKSYTPTEIENFNIFYVSGGNKSRLFYRFANTLWKSMPLSLIQGKETTGANSITLNSVAKKGIIVGGDFANDQSSQNNCVLIDLTSGIKLNSPQTPPHGYRSCVEYITKDKLVTSGTSGVDISNDGGMNWQLISTQSFHVCQKAKNGNAVFLAGANGKIAKLE